MTEQILLLKAEKLCPNYPVYHIHYVCTCMYIVYVIYVWYALPLMKYVSFHTYYMVAETGPGTRMIGTVCIHV